MTQTLIKRAVPGKLPRLLYAIDFFTTTETYTGNQYQRENRRYTANVEEAMLISSEIGNGMHAPALDIDVPLAVVESSTPGNSHLYFDVPMSWRQYKRLLKALAKADILEKNYVAVSINRKHTALRAPWVKK